LIVTPLGTALVAVSVGFALLAKSQRDRRSRASERERPRPRDRRPSLRKREPHGEGVRRVILGQLDLAVELLEQYRDVPPPGPVGGGGAWAGVGQGRVPGAGGLDGQPSPNPARESTVHEVRKALKRLRALLRLVRGDLGEKRYKRENAALRDCGRRLAGARDAEVMLGTLEALVREHPRRLSTSPGVRILRSQLLAEREHAAALAIDDPRVRGEVLAELRVVRARFERWQPRKHGFKLLAPGLERVYRRGRRRMRRARRRESIAALHVWRKQVKELRYAAETLDRGGKSYQPVRVLARRADRLGEMLGEEHDLALLQETVRVRSSLFAGERKTRKRLSRLIAQRRKRLRKRAMRAGEQLYRRPPRRFVRRLERVH
jgi:CHAD domain-containing protein